MLLRSQKEQKKTIELVEYFLANYNIDEDKVYGEGYSGGGLFAEDKEIMGWLFGK